MTREIGRWACEKCGKAIVAVGRRIATFRGIGAFTGPCPWHCGAWMNRGFRCVKPGGVMAYRADEWDQQQPALPAAGA